MNYPLSLFKAKDGNWLHRLAENESQEQLARSEGFKSAGELWPTEKPKGKKQ